MKWFKHYANSTNDPRIACLREEMGYTGIGIYWSIIEMVECQGEGAYPRTQILRLKDRRTTCRRIVEVLDNFGLFVTDEQGMVQAVKKKNATVAALSRQSDGSDVLQTSPRPGSVPATLQENTAEDLVRHSNKLMEDTDTQKLNNEPCIHPVMRAHTMHTKEIRQEEKRENSSSPKNKNDPYAFLEKQFGHESWFPSVREMCSNIPWQEAVCMQSGYSKLLHSHFSEAVRQFVLHARAYDTIHELVNPSRAKYYFNSFIKPGTLTGKRLYDHLIQIDKIRHQQETESDPYRFESRINGRRMVNGHLIPDDAPPCPSPCHYWNEAREEWCLSLYN